MPTAADPQDWLTIFPQQKRDPSTPESTRRTKAEFVERHRGAISFSALNNLPSRSVENTITGQQIVWSEPKNRPAYVDQPGLVARIPMAVIPSIKRGITSPKTMEKEMLKPIKKCLAVMLILQFTVVAALLPGANAALLPTETLLNGAVSSGEVEHVTAFLLQEEVKAEMVRLGVDPQTAVNRISALTPAELEQLRHQITTLPAGGDALAVIGVVFLVLLILELVGVTDIFKKI
jgi:hypothetical protein